VIALTHIVVLVALHGVLRDVADQIGRHGYAILFALIAAESFASPLPGEVSLLVGAYEAQRGVFSLYWVIVVGATAAISGDNLGYLFGRTAGRPVLERLLHALHVPGSYLERMDSYYNRHGGWTVAIARQVSPVRGLAAWSAGGSRVPWRRFFVYNALACIAWATVVTLLAALFVRNLDALADDLSLAGVAALGAVVVVGAVLFWRRVRRRAAARRSHDEQPGDAQPDDERPGEQPHDAHPHDAQPDDDERNDDEAPDGRGDARERSDDEQPDDDGPDDGERRDDGRRPQRLG
jgi:membrane protein DedA with SNARE-associated domain